VFIVSQFVPFFRIFVFHHIFYFSKNANYLFPFFMGIDPPNFVTDPLQVMLHDGQGEIKGTVDSGAGDSFSK
jgi:hypothetical protein